MNKNLLVAVTGLILLNSASVHGAKSDYGVIQMGVVCSGGSCYPSEINQSIVRVAVASSKTNSYGSGTLIYYQNRVYLLTCAHLFEKDTDYATVQFSKQNGRPVQPLAIDREYDLAVLDMPIPGALPSGAVPVKLTATIPLPGARVYAAGYGPNGIFKVTVGTVKGYVQVQGADARDTLQAVYDRKGATVRFGDSGGGVFNESGELVATLWGSDNQCLYGSQIGRIAYFLQSAIPERKPESDREQISKLPPPTMPKPKQTLPEPSLGEEILEGLGLNEPDEPEIIPDVASQFWDWISWIATWTIVILPWVVIVWLFAIQRVLTVSVNKPVSDSSK